MAPTGRRAGLVVIAGLSGSGKTTAARHIVESLEQKDCNAVYIDWAGSELSRLAARYMRSYPVRRTLFYIHLWAALQRLLERLVHAVDLVIVEKWGFDIPFWNDPLAFDIVKDYEIIEPDVIIVLRGGRLESDEGVTPAMCSLLTLDECFDRYVRLVERWARRSMTMPKVKTVEPDPRRVYDELMVTGGVLGLPCLKEHWTL